MILVVIIPAFNEESTIEKVIQKIPKKVKGVKNITILVIDDGSTDKTTKIAKKNNCVVVSHFVNQGVGKALQTGFEKSLKIGADIAVSIDADGQFDPIQIPKAIKPILENKADVVVGSRFSLKKKRTIPKNMPESKYYGNLMMTKFINFLLGTKFEDVSSGFRAYNREALYNLNISGKFTYTQEIFIDLYTKGLKIVNVPVKVKYFANRKSKVSDNLINYTYRSLKIIFRAFRDYKPLLFFFYLSIPFAIGGIVSLVFLIIHYTNTNQVTPYKFVGLIGAYLISVALVLIIIGFLADMFVRVRMNQEKILYLLKRKRD